MLLSIVLSTMSISSISVILYVNYFTARSEKELKELAIQNKFAKSRQSVKQEDEEKKLLIEAV